ncbi:3-hydroxyisobutyrate dehydrogenase family protein [Coccomyxa subellipsoidea C-169]|uniref:3-hydroxyisobutyrate dehydrogenase family protein n=1 Tax=Coccomyxa subellipsoidea (strain C-169) TaxID=574566 RepID=I0Z7Y8_COCSC|nr:3-hydroxyisobutyrate dehydrogenase family protein [Coccomyxa subellipsoidea C-169]EIE26757.1 3-hydroxyisobutyrate dehydrogenase family protein [Coccomyxa subellipsoidea C-169]|eukprot:XP_005651301.1 3-hydroxyisobutyrate dehydrogenase family protein [Coccomyxa subellipsoidea C-169]
MGTSMATNLLEFLSKLSPDDPFERQLHVHNRTQSKTDKLVSQGAVLAPSVADLASACTIVFSMLLNDAAVTSTVEAFLSADPKPGTVFVDCSTVYPNLSEDLSHKAAEKGVLYLTSPIFGRPDAVLAHRGLLVSAGDPAARERVRPLLEAIGQGILDCGDDPRAGSAMKLVGNFFISSWIELAAEGMTLGEKNGVARETVLDFITRLFPGFITTGYAKALVADKFTPTPEDPGFNLEGGMKDVGHMQRLGRESGAPLPVADIVQEHMQQVKNMGGAGLDWSSLSLAVRKEAGLPLSHLQ